MTTKAQRLAILALAELKAALATEEPAPHEGPEFLGSGNCLANIERDYDRRRRGYWFGKAEIKGFGTRFNSGFLDLPALGCTLFVTTEKPPHAPRMASLRAYLWKSADVITLGEFCAYSIKVADEARDIIWKETPAR